MDDVTAFERQVASELVRRAGPVRPVDDVAILADIAAATKSPRWRYQSMFSATKFVAAGALGALFGGLLVAGLSPRIDGDQPAPAAVSPSASPSATEASPSDGLVTEVVWPGVARIIRDDAGHDLDERHPTNKYDMDSIAIGPDGTVWLKTSFSGTDNETNPPGQVAWALGRPGTYGTADGLPEGFDLVALADGSLLAIGEQALRLEDGTFVPDDGPMTRQIGERTLWLLDRDDLLSRLPEGETAVAPPSVLAMIATDTGWMTPQDASRIAQGSGGRFTCWADDGVRCWDGTTETTYLPGTQINAIAASPDGSFWAVGGFDGGGGGLYRITPG